MQGPTNIKKKLRYTRRRILNSWEGWVEYCKYRYIVYTDGGRFAWRRRQLQNSHSVCDKWISKRSRSGMILTGEIWSVRTETCPSANSFITKTTSTWPGNEPGPKLQEAGVWLLEAWPHMGYIEQYFFLHYIFVEWNMIEHVNGVLQRHLYLDCYWHFVQRFA